MPIPGNHLRDNRFMSPDPEARADYWRERSAFLKRTMELIAQRAQASDGSDAEEALTWIYNTANHAVRDDG